MTTPTGTISMTDIQTEFGGANPIGLTEYYAGGLYVPAGLSGVPASGTISMDNLRGKTKATPVVVDLSPTTTAEGGWFYVSFTPGALIYDPLYWSITNLNNLQTTDFSVASGTVYYDYENGDYGDAQFQVLLDSSYEGVGSFTVTVYSNAARTTSVGISGAVTITDSYSASTPTLSRGDIYRYANLNNAYRSTVVSMNTTGLDGATVYYEIYSPSGYTINSNDIDSPGSPTGTITVPVGGTTQLVVRATEWNPGAYVGSNKNLAVRFRLNNASGAILATSPEFTLYRSPNVSFSASPRTVREGYTTTLTAYIDSIPISDPASVSVFYTTEGSTASLLSDFLGFTSTTGELFFTSNSTSYPLTAKIDSSIESNETLYITFRKNSTSGTPFWIIGDNPPSNAPITVESPAMVVDASATDTTVQINNVSAYPESRTFSVLWRVKPTGTGTYGAWNTPITGQSLVAGEYSMTAPAITYTTNPSSNNSSFDYEIMLNSSGYESYSIYRNSVSQTIPVYAVSVRITGANSSGSARQIYMSIPSTPTYPLARTFVVQFSIRDYASTVWGGWSDLAYPAGSTMTITVPANTTAAAEKLIYAGPGSAIFDLKFRVVLAGQELTESNELSDIWLG